MFTKIISDAITAALSAPSPVGDGATPRTERFRNCSNPNLPEEVVAWNFARQLERELAHANHCLAQIDELGGKALFQESSALDRAEKAETALTALRAELAETKYVAESLDNLYVAAQRELAALHSAIDAARAARPARSSKRGTKTADSTCTKRSAHLSAL